LLFGIALNFAAAAENSTAKSSHSKDPSVNSLPYNHPLVVQLQFSYGV
jgi:hypothetical protein